MVKTAKWTDGMNSCNIKYVAVSVEQRRQWSVEKSGEAAGVRHTLKNFRGGSKGSNRPWLEPSINTH